MVMMVTLGVMREGDARCDCEGVGIGNWEFGNYRVARFGGGIPTRMEGDETWSVTAREFWVPWVSE